MQIHALILAGGSGTRFWPSSRRSRPKQLLPLGGDDSLLHRTVKRISASVPATNVWVCTTEALADDVAVDLPMVPREQILAEPEGRNTAAAIGWAVAMMPEEVRRGVIAMLPADHHVEDPPAFCAALESAAEIAAAGKQVLTLGVRPTRVETGYGYLELERLPTGGLDAVTVARFTEKPDLATAEEFVSGGRHLWNAGIFVFSGSLMLDLLTRLQPELARGIESVTAAVDTKEASSLYAELESISIDYAVMERLDDLLTIPLDCGWTDLGSWEAIAELLAGDAGDNRERGDVIAIDATDNLLWADEGTVAVVGIEGLVVVRTGDSVLVIPRERAQDVRLIVERLRADDRSDLL